VLVVQVDVVDAEAPKAPVAGPLHVLGAAVDPASRRVSGSTAKPNLVAISTSSRRVGDRAADELLVRVGPVDLAVSRKVTPSSSARWIVSSPDCSSP